MTALTRTSEQHAILDAAPTPTRSWGQGVPAAMQAVG